MKIQLYFMISALWLFMACHQDACAQNVSINEEGLPGHASSILDVASNNRGVLLPRMTLAQRNAIPAPAEGLLLYQTNGNAGFYVFRSGTWQTLTGGTAEVEMPELYITHSTNFLLTGPVWTLVPGMTLDFTIPSGKTAQAQILADIGVVTNANGNNNFSCTDLAITLDGGVLPDAGYKRVTAGTGTNSSHNNQIKNTVVTGYTQLPAGTYNISLYALRTCSGGQARNAVIGGDSDSLLQGSISVQLIYN